jgi:division/cell wall cluster transcriptional repressor MraZ
VHPLRGEYSTTLDNEGRFIVPLPLRDEFGEPRPDTRLVASLEPEGCISLRTADDWARIADDQFRYARSAIERRAASLFSNLSQTVAQDRQGRIRVADELLRRAGIDRRVDGQRHVVVVGQQRQVRVWSRARWDEQLRALDGEYASTIDEIRNRFSPNRPEGAT